MTQERLIICSFFLLHVFLGFVHGQVGREDKVTAEIIPSTATLDKFGHLYYANSRQEIFKVDETGNQIGYYSNNRLGNVSIIDATNPLKVMAYFRDFYTGIILDRQINEMSSFDMIGLGFGQIDLVATSLNGALWIFNDHEQRINQVDQVGEVLRRGEDLRLLFNERLKPNKIVEADGQLYVNDPARGILIFDLFGNYDTQILKLGLDDFQVQKGHLIYRIGKHLEVYHLDTFLSDQYDISHIGEEDQVLWLEGNRILVVSASGVNQQILTRGF